MNPKFHHHSLLYQVLLLLPLKFLLMVMCEDDDDDDRAATTIAAVNVVSACHLLSAKHVRHSTFLFLMALSRMKKLRLIKYITHTYFFLV